jgi:cytochrome c biogenesis protein CcmG/thiol:disulfide interchange protein DsbE
VVNFFATWCTPCRIEHPQLVEFTERHASAGDVEVVSVAFDDEAARIEEYFAENGGDWTVIPQDTNRAALEFGVTGVPESYVIDPNGLVVAKFEGVTSDGLDEVLAAAGGPVR